MKGVDHRRTDQRGIANSHALTTIQHGLHGRGAWQEWLAGIINITHGATPKDRVLTRCIDAVIYPRNQRVFVVADRSLKAVTGIVQSVAYACVVGGVFAIAEGLVEITGMSF